MTKLFFHTVCLALLMGCATNYNVPSVDVPVVANNLSVRKIPMNVGIVIPDEKFVMTKTMPDFGGDTTLAVPFGELLKQLTLKTLPPAFDSVKIVAGEPYPPGTDALLIPTVEDFYKEPEGGKPSLVEVTLRSELVDVTGKPIWSKTFKVKEQEQAPYLWSYEANARFWGGMIAKALAKALNETARDLSSSRDVHLFASTKGKPAAPPAAQPDSSVVVRSDVDEPPALRVKTNSKSVAIVIGIEKYREKLPAADFAGHDARVVSDYLVKSLGFPEENVVTLLNDRASMSDMTKYLEKWLANNAEKEGSVFIYYSGHGAPNPKTGDAYLVPYDGDPSFIDQTGYSLKRLYENLNRVQAKEIVVAIDSCFSGAGGRSVLAKGARPLVIDIDKSVMDSGKVTVLSAAAGDQVSSTYQEKGHGLFTYFMLKGIRNEDVTGQDGSIRIDDLFSYLKPQVERIARKQYNNEQTPQLSAPHRK